MAGRPHAHEASLVQLAVEGGPHPDAPLSIYGAHVEGDFDIRAVDVRDFFDDRRKGPFHPTASTDKIPGGTRGYSL